MTVPSTKDRNGDPNIGIEQPVAAICNYPTFPRSGGSPIDETPHSQGEAAERNSELTMSTIAEHKSEFGLVTICESKETRGLSYKHGDVFQSEADARGVSTAGYIHAIYGLIRQTKMRKVLMIGCG